MTTPQQVGQSCATCLYWIEVPVQDIYIVKVMDGHEYRRQCRRRAPALNSPMPPATWPQTMAIDWCGEWKPTL